MIFTRIFTRTVLICLLLVTTTTQAQRLDGDVNTWIQLYDEMTIGWVKALEAGERRFYAGHILEYSSPTIMGALGVRPRLKKISLRLQSIGKRFMPEHLPTAYFGRMTPG